MTLTRRDILFAAALLLGTVLVFAQVREFDFITLDDPHYIAANDRVQQGLTWANVRWAFTTTYIANWHPLTWLSYMADVELFGPGPAVPHVVNVALHAVNVVLVYLVLTLLTGRAGPSAVVAALFAVHPLRMESVAWISERKDVLCGMFYLLAIGAYGMYVHSGTAASPVQEESSPHGRADRAAHWWYVAVIVAMALGMMCKPSIVTLPCVLLLLDCWPLKRPARWGLVVEKLPLFALSIVSAIVTMIAQRGAMGTAPPPLAARVANAFWAYARYVKKTMWPSDLAAFYPYPGLVRGTDFPWGLAIISAVVIVAITGLAIVLWKRERAILIGWLWFCGVLVPSIGIVQVGLQSMADRYTYLPHIGLFIAIVWGLERALGRNGPVVAGVAIAIFAGSTGYQLRYWQNSYTLFQRALVATENNPSANMNIAVWLTKQGRGDEALPYYEETLRLQPNSADARNNIGNYFRERGDLPEALRHLQAATQLDPRYADGHFNLANVLGDLGRTDDAEREYRRAIELDAENAQYRYNLGVLLAGAGRFEEATVFFQRAMELRPTFVDARFMHALALLETGQRDTAKTEFEAALAARPDWTDAMGRFAWVLATSPREASRDPVAAVQLAHHACRLTNFNHPQLLDTLAAAYAAAGKFEPAVQAATRARDLAASRGVGTFAERVEQRLKLYESGKPFIATPPTTPATVPTSSPAR